MDKELYRQRYLNGEFVDDSAFHARRRKIDKLIADQGKDDDLLLSILTIISVFIGFVGVIVTLFFAYEIDTHPAIVVGVLAVVGLLVLWREKVWALVKRFREL